MAHIQVGDITPRIQITATAGQTQATYSFPVFVDSDLKVYIGSVQKTLATDYTVSGAGDDNGGTVTFNTGLTAGDVVTIIRDVPVQRTSDYQTNGDLLADTLNDDLDKLTMMTQQNETLHATALSVNPFDTYSNLVLPAKDDRVGRVLAFNETTGDPEQGPTITDVQTVSNASADIATLADIEDGTNATGAISTVSNNISNVQTVASVGQAGLQGIVDNEDNIADVAGEIIPTNNIATVASRATDIGTVALRDADIGTVAGQISPTNNLLTVANRDADIETVALRDADIGTVALNIGKVETVADNIDDVIKVADDLNEAISEVVTVADDLNEATSEIEVVADNILNVNKVGAIDGDVTTVALNDSNVTKVGAIDTDVTTVAHIQDGTVATNAVTKVASIDTDVTKVATVDTKVSDVADNINGTNTIGTVATDLAGNNYISTVGADISNVNEVAGNIGTINAFGERYRVATSAPSTDNDAGDLYFDTGTDTMKVYGGSGWQNAGSSVNGTSARYDYVVGTSSGSYTGSVTTFPAVYDAGYVDVYLNGVKLAPSDFTGSSGTDIVLSASATTGHPISIVGYGTFSVATVALDDLTTVDVGSATDGQHLIYNSTSSKWQPGEVEDTTGKSIAMAMIFG